MTRFVAEFYGGHGPTTTAIDAPNVEAARAAATLYAEVNPRSRLLAIREEPAYLRVTPEGVVEHLWLRGRFLPLAPGRESIPVPRERVLVFMLEDGSEGPVRAERVPADWDTEDCERYTGGDAGDGVWDRCALVDLEEVKEEKE